MKATIVDLRYKMNDVLKALARKEEVTILYRGKVKGKIIPETGKTSKKVQDLKFYGMNRGEKLTVKEELDQLRESRTNVI